ncbi:MAG: NUDIX hydrolase [Bryobacteraceae bacterium]|nr:NUDIX hydrolase [Bryobacteraceae bacterium]
MKIISSVEKLNNGLFRVTEDVAEDDDGFEIRRNIVRHNGSAVVMPVDEADRILLVRQYRLPAKQKLWELPAGKIDEGETALAAAKRELREETGLRAKTWTKLAAYWASPGFLEEKMNLYLATGLTQGESEWMEDERIETRWFPWAEIDGLIAGGKMNDGKTLIGFLAWKRYHAK